MVPERARVLVWPSLRRLVQALLLASWPPRHLVAVAWLAVVEQ
jgi:hypothetical protein